MKKIFLLTMMGIGTIASAQNGVSGPIALFGLANASTTTINTGGTITLGTGANWTLAGNIISADKGNGNAPSAAGRAESVIFDGGIYSGATTTPGATGNLIDGYISTTANNILATLPLGNATVVFPLIIPAGTAIKAAYFDGGGTSNSAISGVSNGSIALEYSQYYDVPGGFSGGSYAVSYPAALPSSGFNNIATSTDNGITFVQGANVNPIGITASTTNMVALAPVAGNVRLYLATSPVLLPVNLPGFTATKNSNQTATLNWQTTQEQNSKYFAILRSTDGAGNWQTIGQVAAAGISTSNYQYTDNNPNRGMNYYCLKLTNADGKFIYSNSKLLRFDDNSKIVVLPNPVTEKLFVNSNSNIKELQLFDQMGKLLWQTIHFTNGGPVDMSHFANGMYQLRIVTADGHVETHSFIKQ